MYFNLMILRSLQKASADFSACTTWGVFNARDESNRPYAAAILLDAWKERLEYPDLRKTSTREL